VPDRFEDGLVSVIIPAFNRAHWLADAVNSVLAQTHGRSEVLVVDDGSTDATFEVARRLADSDPRVRPFRQANAGVAAARNLALAAARGRYVAFLDSDDWWLPEKLERQVAAIVATDAKLCFTGFRRVREGADTPGDQVRVPARVGHRQLLRTNHIATTTCLVDRARAGDFRMVAVNHDDYATWLSLLRPGGWALGLDEDLARYRVAGESLSSNKWRSARETWQVFRRAEGLGLLPAAMAFLSYGIHGTLKHVRTAV
jgi:teichuronic acid biosynthesis glycosyltransferase TuaG